jgi:RimJ/RimL family protein N-acetyltransferase
VSPIDVHHGAAGIQLADGGWITVRPISPADGPALARFHDALSDESRYHRFLSPHPHLTDDEVHHLTELDHPDRVAYVAESRDELIAVGRYERSGDTAEVAFTVADDHQGRGIGTILLSVLATCAASHGITSFFADVLCENHAMVRVFRDAGFSLQSEVAAGVIHLVFDLDRRTA